MKLLWVRGESAVADLVSAVGDEMPLAYTSVLTTVRILERKGYVQHRQEGRAFLYSPCVAEHEAGRSEVQHLLQRFFGNSRERLLLSLLGDHEVTAEELNRLKRAIAAAPDDPLGEPNGAPNKTSKAHTQTSKAPGQISKAPSQISKAPSRTSKAHSRTDDDGEEA